MYRSLKSYALLSSMICMAPQLAQGVGTVYVTNVTNETVYAAIVCTEFNIRNTSKRFMKLYINTHDEGYVTDNSANLKEKEKNFIERLPVWAIPPGKTAAIQSYPWDALHYDRNLWVTKNITDLSNAMLKGRETVASTKLAFFNIGSSTAPRYVGFKPNTTGKDRPLALFTKPQEAESASGLSLQALQAQGVNFPNAESDQLKSMRSMAARLTFKVDAAIAKGKQLLQKAGQAIQQGVQDVQQGYQNIKSGYQEQAQQQRLADSKAKAADIAAKYR